MKRAILFALSLASCAGPDLDGAAAASRVRASAFLLDECRDGGPCDPAKVRALERPLLCSAAAEVARHGGDAGVAGCRP